MIINVDGLTRAGVHVEVTRDGQRINHDGLKLELHFVNGKFPQELHDVLHEMMPGLEVEANVIGEHTTKKINAFMLAQAIEKTGEER